MRTKTTVGGRVYGSTSIQQEQECEKDTQSREKPAALKQTASAGGSNKGGQLGVDGLTAQAVSWPGAVAEGIVRMMSESPGSVIDSVHTCNAH